ncbi:MAG TPA: aldo/keto reductase [Vicinamibacterales bacterium]|jgi:aryl-alcohol dehydrogenase-like predicted oxidoreductase|nr:aldo/keto reductase [Vicinamibacterales bacterium]
MMRYRVLGKSGLRVSELCLGTMTFMEGLPWGSLRAESERVFEEFMEAGGNFVDTSNTYGTSEEFLAEFMRGRRERVVVGTKYGGSLPSNDANAAGSHRKSLVRSVEGSLRRLKTEYIDLLWLNAWDFMTPIEEIMRALDDLVQQSKVLHIGVSNTSAWFVARANTIAEFRGWTPFVAIQVAYNLLQRDVERELLPMANELDIGVLAWTPLASGFLTGKYQAAASVTNAVKTLSSETRRLDDPVAANFVRRTERTALIASEVSRQAAEIGVAPAQIALNWLRRRGVIPLFGARTAVQVKENVASIDFELSNEHMCRLDEASRISLGFPHDFLASRLVRDHMYGGMFDAIHGSPTVPDQLPNRPNHNLEALPSLRRNAWRAAI